MGEPRLLSVSWDAYQNNICSGLSHLQQRGEFVDMTLAADGHHVKVHQMVMSLVSPYIKELISSAQCPHPVIFLNNISHATLNSILQYIYTGEALVPTERLPDVLAAAKALHIKGLKDMDINKPQAEIKNDSSPIAYKVPKKNYLLEKLQEHKENKKNEVNAKKESPQPFHKIFVDVNTNESMDEDEDRTATETTDTSTTTVTRDSEEKMPDDMTDSKALDMYKENKHKIQFSISNQGGLQLIFNRYIYSLKYIQKKLLRVWRCVNSSHKKCPAMIYTNENNEVVKRSFSHNHPFHDQKILKKHRLGNMYSAFSEAESHARYKKTYDKEETSTVSQSTTENIEIDSD